MQVTKRAREDQSKKAASTVCKVSMKTAKH
jgi:hypothetical protein